MSLLYDSWLIPLLSMNQDAFLYNTLAHDTTTPHGYQRAANVGTKSHQHKIKHGNRRNKHPRKIPEKSWYESCEVPRGMNFIWIAFLVALLEIQRSIRPMSFHATLPSWQGFAAQRSGSGSSNMLWPRERNHPLVCQWHDAPRLDDSKVICPFEHEVGTHLKCQIPNFLKQFCQLEAAIWSVFGSELPTLLYDLLFAPCSRSAPETPSWSRSQFLKGKQTHFPIRKHWWKLVLLVCLAKTSEMIGDSCTFQKHKTSHQFYRWQVKTTLCNRFPKDCLLETHLKIEKTHHSSKLLNIIQSITQPQANLHANLHAIDARRFLMVSASKVSRISHDRWKSCVWM